MVAEQQDVRTFDALHLGAALRLGTGATFITFDVRQAQAARALGFGVSGS
jgi:predicted nucleic acid-binding protein